LATAT